MFNNIGHQSHQTLHIPTTLKFKFKKKEVKHLLVVK